MCNTIHETNTPSQSARILTQTAPGLLVVSILSPRMMTIGDLTPRTAGVGGKGHSSTFCEVDPLFFPLSLTWSNRAF